MLSHLRQHGAATSAQIQQATQKSQATVSRLLGGLSSQVLRLGRGRSTRYAAPENIGDASPQQSLWLIGQSGQVRSIGTLSLLANAQLHVGADKFDEYASALPWYLSPLRVQGFLGRLLARRLATQGLLSDPEMWDLRAVLMAALRLHDAPGAIVMGQDNAHAHAARSLPHGAGLALALDAWASDVAQTLPAGSSAGGEQPKFPALLADGQYVLVKFSPPRGTPFGERWNDLLHAEQLGSEIFARHGHAAAPSRVVQSPTRTYLLSERFDRLGTAGRRHVVALGAAHAAFVPGSYNGWGASCEALARQGRLPEGDAAAAMFRQQFGRLIGNSDMHSGNLGLFAHGETLREMAKGRFGISPSYDMLPMRWKPDPVTGALDYDPFDTSGMAASAPAREAAHAFWSALTDHPAVSAPMRQTASEMARRVGAANMDSRSSRE